MNEAASVSSLESHLGYWLRAVSNNVSQGFARKLEDEGVTVAEWVFLRMLFDFETVSPSALAEAMGMTRGAISKLADRLVAKELVERGASLADKRAQTLALKPAGRARVPMLAALADRNDTEFFGVLDEEERGELDRLLRKIVAGRGLAVVTTD
ncbi:MarR family transcriptional regulator (plasmid) [Rhizobium sp. TRM96647]|uniref:MarR family winged helix-turn-helix transcriptional regulator n=1 Tax=unclassified Rhizobium TaxID=2613769 RepID=UPI0021E723CD|nr:MULTISPECIES: MarR family transcriptional regulator [unclassified Rhizobium]MCV3735546.1 MarR family transcriptional regulator [Rhizobium sp. TRM96647]MCV3757691.1 MarR family transcriptional regulator [Rhizobium sp. TRM96650]